MEKTKILIVEDNPIVAEDLKTKLIHLGYDITATAYSGEQALESLKYQRPDIALMDIRLGDGMNGIDTALKLKEIYAVSVIYLTAHADDDTISQAKATEPYGYIVKPFDDTEIKSVIEIAVFRQQSDRKARESQQWFQTTLSSIEAVETFRQTPDLFHLVITDMTMPGMTGDKLAQAVKVIKPDIPVILCTGFSEKINEKTASDFLVDGFLMKPIDIKKMAETVRNVLDKK